MSVFLFVARTMGCRLARLALDSRGCAWAAAVLVLSMSLFHTYGPASCLPCAHVHFRGSERASTLSVDPKYLPSNTRATENAVAEVRADHP